MSTRYHYVGTQADGIGIALAGGGVRAACLGLGALQVAEESGLLGRTAYVSAVSGGSYTATAFISARAASRPEGGAAPWSHGSPEEAHLRRNLRYLGEDFPDLFLSMVRYLVSAVLNLVPFAAAVALAACVLGGVYKAGALLGGEDALYARFPEARWTVAAVIAAVAVLAEFKLGRAERVVRRVVLGVVLVLLLPDVVAAGTHVLRASMFDGSSIPRLLGLGALMAAVAFAVFRSQWGFSASRVRQTLRQLVRILFDTIMGAVLVLPLLLSIGHVSQLPYRTIGVVAAVAVLLLLVFGLLVPANRTSLHRAYSRRLDRAYVVRAGERPVRLSEVLLTDTHTDGLPRLLVCTSVNLRAEESAQGEGCASFVFSADYVGSAAIGTGDLPAFACRLDAASLVAASGAAVAPNMGRYTGRASRIALALMNLRLGLWLENPLVGRPGNRIRDLLPAGLADTWYAPGPLSTWREALGDLSVTHGHIFISDGGHWDNSGVVELLRRRCRTVFAVDASVDEFRLGNALRMISLARAELGVEFDADGLLLESRAPVLKIPFRYPDDTEDDPEAYLILMRSHISKDMPSDLVALAADRTAFPRHSTLNQFLAARDVDAYIALGRWLFQRGLVAADLIPVFAATPGPANVIDDTIVGDAA
ncbi:hypothetical protein Aph01nite_01250 [Acrocarpospora phusangensis]|uniref:PNPLA domain-containing protein n=1 Tax=Acrocarpospora phusangensis TaxID=1070424 RepID=A0A919UMJ4_9ACTN|nr:hypothetical protein [Acrocarpospora phusangensis]GIH21815.1 hypothetical protein Aph01nite_01250 [Acrocarpospora phusangensis]